MSTNMPIKCNDCSKEIEIKKDKLINAVGLVYESDGEKVSIYKCSECYDKNKELQNFRPCEVYSRIVGYLRPVSQWNKGKQEEFSVRKVYEIK